MAILHLGAAAALLGSALLPVFKIAALALVGANACNALYRSTGNGAVTWFSDNRWVLRDGDGECQLSLCADSVVTRHFSVLVLRAGDGDWRRSLVLTPASLHPRVYRRLIVRLRLDAAGLG